MADKVTGEILSKEEIEFFKANKHEITPELLNALRESGNKGKAIALEILDIDKNDKMFYVDAFGEAISFEGNKGLKKAGTTLALSKIHEDEIIRCADDFRYFRENYIRIKTPHGIDFPDVRPYQDRFIDKLLMDEKEEIVGLMGRQCISGDTELDMDDRNRTIKELFDNPEL